MPRQRKNLFAVELVAALNQAFAHFNPLAYATFKARRDAMASATPITRPKKKKDPIQVLVNSMSNWQRNQWARAGYPGLHGGTDEARLAKIGKFCEMTRNPS